MVILILESVQHIDQGALEVLGNLFSLEFGLKEDLLRELSLIGVNKIHDLSFNVDVLNIDELCSAAKLYSIESISVNYRTINFPPTTTTISEGIQYQYLSICEEIKEIVLVYESEFAGTLILLDVHLIFQIFSNLSLIDISSHVLRPTDFQSLCLSFPQSVKQLSFVYLNSNNMGKVISHQFMCFTNLETLELVASNISIIQNFSFIGLIKLTHLNLSKNKISYIYQNTFSGLYGLTALDLQENPISQIETNSFGHFINLCTLLLGDLNFSPHMSLIKLNLSDIFGRIPYNLSHMIISSGLRPMQLVIGSNTTLNKSLDFTIKGQYANLGIMFHNLTKLRTLILINCRIFFLDGSLTKDLSALTGLALMPRDHVNILQNFVEHLTSLRYLQLQGLNLYCSCDNAWLVSWVDNRQVQVSMYRPTMKELQCLADNGMDHLNFILYTKENCSFSIEFVLFVSTSAFLFFFMIGVLSYQCAGQYIKPFYNIASGWFREALHLNGKQWYRYDVFVSYSCKDEHWVINELLPNLEQRGPPFLRVCLHSRDFRLGQDIVENITDCIYASRRTLCLVSHNYLRSNWCSLEMQLATYRLQVEHRDILNLVFLEKIPSRLLSSHHRLARLVKSRTYLDWPLDPEMHEAFWHRLWCKLNSYKDY
ncbi:toll-like receptor 13 [Xyrauchen texanus]|uniref:toll-like receptor 13 n=1 Tax=Xyrauchen texanus TaxID=154827 RepID=UPI0022420D8E|nr:toll-like receptor 13 [Xyrauchen texanus]